MPITRKIDLLVCLLGCIILGYALYLEIYVGIKPCPLCTIQRFILLITLLLFLLGGLLPLINFTRRFYHFFIFLVAGSGAAVAARHVWLTLQPAGTVPSCEASIDIMLEYMPLKDVIQSLLQGGADCHVITWRFLSLSIPEWSLISFTFMALVALWQVFYKDRLWAA